MKNQIDKEEIVIECKYCEKEIDGVLFQRSDNGEINCEPCEVITRVVMDVLSEKARYIGAEEDEEGNKVGECSWGKCRE